VKLRADQLGAGLAVALLGWSCAAMGQAVGESVPMRRAVVPVVTKVEPPPPGPASSGVAGTVVGGAIVDGEAAAGTVGPAAVPVAAATGAATGTATGTATTAVPSGEAAAGLIRRARSVEGSTEAGSAATEEGRLSGAAWETLRVILGLGVVLGLIVGMKMGAGKLLGLKGVGTRANRGVRVLSRTVMGHRQQLVLLQVGRKLVLVSDSGGQVSTVTEVTDPDEVAELAAQALGGSEDGVVGFGSSLGRQLRRVRTAGAEVLEDGEEWVSLPEDRASVSRAESLPAEVDLSGLSERVRLLGRQFSATH
jgi:flagellar biogenesis protein FliO